MPRKTLPIAALTALPLSLGSALFAAPDDPLRASALNRGLAGAVAAADLPGDIALARAEKILDSGGRVAWYKGPARHELIAYDAIVNQAKRNTDLFIMKPDGSGRVNVTARNPAVPRGFIGQPDWHPDGQRLIFQAEGPNSDHGRFNHMSFGIDCDLWIIKADGSGAERIYRSPRGGAVLHPHFDESGRRLIFAERQATGQRIHPPRADGSELTPLGENPWAGWRIHIADFDENGRGLRRLKNHRTLYDGLPPRLRGFYETHGFRGPDHILISRTLGGRAYVDDVFLAPLDGRPPLNLTRRPDSWEEHGLLSPSGRTLAFISSRFSSYRSGDSILTLRTELYLQRGDTARRLTLFNLGAPAGVRTLVSDFEWDRSGRRIVLQAAPVDSVGRALPIENWIITFARPM